LPEIVNSCSSELVVVVTNVVQP